MDRHYQVRQECAFEVTAAFHDAGGGLLRALADVGHGEQARDGFAVARDGQALALGCAVKQPGQVPSGLGGADSFHRGPRFGVGRDMGAVGAGGKLSAAA